MWDKLREYMDAAFNVAMEAGALSVEVDGIDHTREQRKALLVALKELARTHGVLIKDRAYIRVLLGEGE